MIITTEYVDIPVGAGLMRTFVAAPKPPGRYPGILFYSDIFQLTVDETPKEPVSFT